VPSRSAETLLAMMAGQQQAAVIRIFGACTAGRLRAAWSWYHRWVFCDSAMTRIFTNYVA
jgi:hypothetical protein